MIVARVTKWFSENSFKNHIAGEPWWLICRDDERTELMVECVIGRKGKPLNYLLRSDGDEFEIIPENQWPDEVCVAIAKRVLAGDNE